MRYTFFSFCYDDVKNFKVNVVRNSWRINNSNNTFIDGSIWEKEKSRGEKAIKKIIEEGLLKTSVTAVLIGTETAKRRWVKYEIIKSFEKGNGLIGLYINRIRGKDGYIDARAYNPLDRLGFEISKDGQRIRFYELIERAWKPFTDFPEINNKKSNTLHFEDGFFSNDFGKFFLFSEKFKTYCWDKDDGRKNLSNWIENAANQAKR